MFISFYSSEIRSRSLKEKVLVCRSASDSLEARLRFSCRLHRPWYHTLFKRSQAVVVSGSGYLLSSSGCGDLNVPVLVSCSISGFSGETELDIF